MLASGSLVDALPAVNATLNGTSAVLVVLGWRAVKAGHVDRHRRLMLSAVGVSAVFLVCYLIRVSLAGTHRFAGPDWLRGIYLTILFSHMVLAMVTVPLVLRAAYLGLRDRIEQHVRWVRWTLPIWLYVSVTGVLIYFLLYHVSA